jgi:endonuclease YncB( thermonuclease family)
MFRLVTLCLALAVASPVAAHARYRAIDGDTLASGTARIRLVDYDTPETLHARCPEERALGLKAKDRLQALVTRGPTKLVRLKGRDKYGRSLGRLFVAAEPVSVILIREALAVPYTKRVSRLRNFNWCENLKAGWPT